MVESCKNNTQLTLGNTKTAKLEIPLKKYILPSLIPGGC